jgi:hypothetical protein
MRGALFLFDGLACITLRIGFVRYIVWQFTVPPP